MVPEVFVVCDGANDSHGKLNILGAFDTIVAGEFPVVHPHCTIAMRLRYTPADGHESVLKLIIKGSSSEADLAAIDTTVKHSASITPTSTANLIVNLHSLRFDQPGDYSINLQVDGIPAAVIPLYVRASAIGSKH